MRAPHRPGVTCSSCRACGAPAAGLAQEHPDRVEDSGLRGRRLVLAAFAFFVAPIVLAIIGAFIAGDSDGAQFLGAVAGLAVGMGGSALLAKLVCRPDGRLFHKQDGEAAVSHDHTDHESVTSL